MGNEPIFVDTDWLSERLDSGLATVDVRPPQFYTQEHIPGAVNLPIFFLSSPSGGPPESEALARRLGSLGITRDTHVVAYDDGSSPAAAVLFRLLNYFQHPKASVLDGGITKWRREGRDVEYQPVRPDPATYDIGAPNPAAAADVDRVLGALGKDDTAILDVRSPAEYLGLQRTAHRDGHIPGAVNIEWSNNLELTAEMINELRPDSELRELYEGMGVTPDKSVIVYCQTGARASATYAVLKTLGYERVATFVPGWQEWGNLPDTPVEGS
jgi:thiosulfate/3-mercaptopyruvate sulfurtransferase